VQDLGVCHPGCQVFENIIDGDAQSANAWFSIALAGFNRNDVRILHSLSVGEKLQAGKERNIAFSWRRLRHLPWRILYTS
jgi:hypothetical protein